jgi:predicted MFS family arabinose efflux permease
MLLAGRVLMGLGAGGLNTLTMALIGEAVPPRERGRFQAWIAGCFVLASSLGPVAGGWLAETYGWRAVFLSQVPATALAFALALRLPRRPPRSPGAAFRFDLGRGGAVAAFVTPALVALSQARLLSLAALPVAAGFALAAALAAWLLLRQERRAKDPLLPLPMLAEPSILRTNLFTACAHGCQVALVTFLPLWLISVRGLTLAEAGAMLVPLSPCGGVGRVAGGADHGALGLGGAVAAAGAGAGARRRWWGWRHWAGCCRAGALWGCWRWWGLGMGCSYPVSQITVQVAAGPARLGAAAASVQYAAPGGRGGHHAAGRGAVRGPGRGRRGGGGDVRPAGARGAGGVLPAWARPSGWRCARG